MTARPVMVQLRHNPKLEAQATSQLGGAHLDVTAVPSIAGLVFDPRYAPVHLPALVARPRTGHKSDIGVALELDPVTEHATYVVRAEADDIQVEALRKHEAVVGVFDDPRIAPFQTCSDTPVGDVHDVEHLLRVEELIDCGMDGKGVYVAIVDSGVNIAYLNSVGKTPNFIHKLSWGYEPGLPLGDMPVDHGTMCAFDACIAAPACTLLDIALLQPLGPGGSTFSALLSDAVKAYSHLMDLMVPVELLKGPWKPKTGPKGLKPKLWQRTLVVSNSWGIYNPNVESGALLNYIDNINHPFNQSVAALEVAGADIVFAAGNCGPECPHPACSTLSPSAILGANGHPQVLTVAGVDTNLERVGYSSIGPASLADKKPDICGYTHFAGSGIDLIDGGTSAAAPVVAGVVAAVRSKRRYASGNPETWPAAIRSLITSTAFDLSQSGWDYETGYGVVDGHALRLKFCATFPQKCAAHPWLCWEICKQFPWVCEGVSKWPKIPGPGPIEEVPDPLNPKFIRSIKRLAKLSGITDPLELAAVMSLLLSTRTPGPAVPLGSVAKEGSNPGKGDCGCGGKH